MSILQCKIFSDYHYIAEKEFNDWCKENNIGPYDIKDIKYTIHTRNGDHCIFVLYSKEIESNSIAAEDPNKYLMYTGMPN